MNEPTRSANGTQYYYPALRRAQRSLRAGVIPPGVERLCEKMHLLAALCREFQSEAGDAPFFISVRLAARVMVVNEETAWRYLRLLMQLDVLQMVERADQAKKQAARYRYVWAGSVRERPAAYCPDLRL